MNLRSKYVVNIIFYRCQYIHWCLVTNDSTNPDAGRNRERQPPAQNPCSDEALLRIPDNLPGIDPATDILLFRSSRYSLYTFEPIKRGTDIYVRIKPDRPAHCFLRHWSEQQDICTPVSEECAIRILRGLASIPETIMYMEFENILHFLPGYFKKNFWD